MVGLDTSSSWVKTPAFDNVGCAESLAGIGKIRPNSLAVPQKRGWNTYVSAPFLWTTTMSCLGSTLMPLPKGAPQGRAAGAAKATARRVARASLVRMVVSFQRAAAG